jgi:hypothetical protein
MDFDAAEIDVGLARGQADIRRCGRRGRRLRRRAGRDPGSGADSTHHKKLPPTDHGFSVALRSVVSGDSENNNE